MSAQGQKSMNEDSSRLPLSFAQQRSWSLAQLSPENPWDNFPAGVRLKGRLDVRALERALNEIVRRHEILRTRFECQDGTPVQVIESKATLTLPFEDLTDVGRADQDQRVAEESRAEARCPFDLSRAPLMRARLLKLGADEYVLLLTMHHMVSDDWSVGVLLREAAALYSAFTEGKPPLPPLDLQYADYAAWQQEWLNTEVAREELRYWTERLQGALDLTQPADLPLPSALFCSAASASLVLEKELTAELREFSRRERVTLFMVMLAAMYVLLRREHNQEDIVVGSPIACRTRAEVQNLIGPFENALALRTQLSGNLTFRELLARVREACVAAYRHQELPFDLIHKHLRPDQGPKRSPLFRFWFALQNTTETDLGFDGLRASYFSRKMEGSRFEREWNVLDGGNELGVHVTCPEILQPEVELMLARYRGLLQEMVSNPDGHVVDRADGAEVSQTSRVINREILLNPGVSAYLVREFEPPQTAIEEVVAALWTDVLHVERVGRHDNFFELGGHSLLAVRLMHRMQAAGFSVDVPTIFAAPSVAQLSAQLSPLDKVANVAPHPIPSVCAVIEPEMLSLLQLTSEQIETIVATIPGSAANVQDIYPLLPLQEGMLFHHLMTLEADPYVSSIELSFENRLLVDGYIRALQAVVDRHDILRTALVWEGGAEPMQVVMRKADVRVEEVALDPYPRDVANRLYKCFGSRKIDLGNPPLLRVYIAQDGESGGWKMLQILHHAIADQRTLELMKREIEAYLLGEEASLPQPIPFRKVVAQSRLGANREDHEAYFRKLLGDVDEPTAPFGLANTQGDGRQIEEKELVLDSELARRVRERARHLEVSATSVFHLAWAQVLARSSRHSDVVFGTVLFGRMQGGEDTDRIAGPLVNTLPVRIRIGAQEAAESIQQTHLQLTELMRHEHTPLSLAQSCSGIQPPAPLFSALLNYRHHLRPAQRPSKNNEGELWRGIHLLSSHERTNYPLALSIDDWGDNFTLTVQVQTRVDASRVLEMMSAALDSLVAALETGPTTPICRLNVLPERELRQVLYEWNETGKEFPRDRCIHVLFEQQVEKTPRAVAVVFEDAELSYADLNVRANGLAHYLRQLGVGPDERVAICIERGFEMIVALLAVLKAGGAYVPLDPGYPRERLRHMLEDSDPVALLTQSHLKGLFEGFSERLRVLDLSDGGTEWSGQPETNPELGCVGLMPKHLAYVLYTSGSTGQPKGVMVQHANVARLFSATHEWFRFSAEDIWSFYHSYAFDFSVWEIWGALLYGGRLVVVPKDVARSPDDFYRLVCREKVTVLNLTPSVFRQLVAAQAKREVSHELRHVIFGGEALDVTSLQPWFEQSRNLPVRLVNMYGITETTVHATYRVIEQKDTLRRGGSPIGCPIPDLRIYILDEQQQPVPIGVVGEMYVGGAGVARGYLNRPELTASRFLDDPFAGDRDGRMYRTGDLGRWLNDGNIEFLGRNDFQIKIRGFRIELEEIEAGLMEQVGVREAVVLAREDEPGQKRLVAYYTASGADECKPDGVNAELLRTHLLARLPEYMVPAAYMRLESFPLTTNGKLDRKALPAPDGGAYAVRRYEAPRGEIETKLAAIWAEVLKLDRVGRDDNFFELGGDSMRTIVVLSKATEAGLAITLVQLFEYQSVRTLAEALVVTSPSGLSLAQPSNVSLISDADRVLLPADIEDAYGLTRLQLGMIFHNQFSPELGTYHDVFSYRLQICDWDLKIFQTALATLVQKHPILRTSFSLHRYAEPLQLVHTTAQIPVTVVDLRELDAHAQGRTIADLIQGEKETQFDLDKPPLLRIFIHHLGVDTLQYTLGFHHAILDGWSVASFQAELFIEYERQASSRDNAPAALKPLNSSFKKAVERERLALQSENSKSFWQEFLAGHSSPSLPPFPINGSPSLVRFFELSLPSHLEKGLNAVAASLHVPLRTVLLTAHLRVVSLLSGTEDVVAGMVSHMRLEEVDGERVLGLFLNTLPFRQKLGAGMWEELIRTTFETELRLMPHRCYPYSQIFIDNDRVPIFETAFNFTNFHVYDAIQETGGIEVLDSSGFEATNFALTLNASNRGGNLACTLAFDPERFSLSQIERFAGYYQSVLESIATNPNALHQECSALSASERQRVLREWNITDTKFSSERCVHELFEEQARKTPEATAMVYQDKFLTYAELNRRANRLAHYLRELGVRPDARVAICVERGFEMIVGVLAVLKAAGGYVPLEPTCPMERLRCVLDDSGATTLLTQGLLAERFTGRSDSLRVLNLEDTAAWAGLPERNLDRGETGLVPEHLAYVIYTSGSTGAPKGVMIEHRNLTRLFTATDAWYGFTAIDVWSLFHSYAFDFSVWEIWGALSNGGRLVIVPQETARSAEDFYRLLCREKVTVLSQTPSAFRQLITAQSTNSARHHLRTVIFGGEALEVTTLKPWYEQNRDSNTRLVNMYGITETTVHVTYRPLEPADTERRGASPIGIRIPDLRTYILDQHGQPVPVGVVGELYVGGAGVARGYLNRQDLTAERFLKDPFAQDPGARMYRTGDLGRWQEDGTIEFLGRNDLQVKIRGFRVELGEIEARLRQHAGVREAVVIAREDVLGEKRLVAYYTRADSGGEDAETVGAERLHGHLAACLPDYMVPAAYVRLERLPMTVNGKLDREALPVPDPNSHPMHDYTAPRTPMEEMLCRIWEDLLGLERIGVDQNFFEIGGHSLLATQAVARMRAAFEVDLSLRALYEKPSVAGIADAILRLQIQQTSPEIVEELVANVKGLSSEQIGALLKSYSVTAR
jgi:amino acid adenylation domain-containing protein